MNVYLHDWSRKDYSDREGKEALCAAFEIDESELVGAEVLLASYTYEDCSGDAFVLFRRAGKLYEVNGGHCSCYGLEGQWEPEETTVEALRLRKRHCDYGAELQQLLVTL